MGLLRRLDEAVGGGEYEALEVLVGDRVERRAFGDSAFPVGDSGRSFGGGNVYPAGM